MARDEWLVAILLSSPVTAEQIEAMVPSVERREARHNLPDRPEHSLIARGEEHSVIIDVFSHRWHDSSGDDSGPTSPMYLHDPEHDHLVAEPWSLKRAVQQYRGPDDAAIHAANHSAYLLLRLRGESGASAFCYLIEVAQKLLRGVEESCFFNPRGESLAGLAYLDDTSRRCQARGLPPIELLVNPRIFEVGAGWSLADCVGLSQLQLPDQEVIFCQKTLSAREALDFVRNLAIHFIQHHPAVGPGDTAGGPGASLWEAMPLGQAAISPHRPVVRWFPENREGMPGGLQTA